MFLAVFYGFSGLRTALAFSLRLDLNSYAKKDVEFKNRKLSQLPLRRHLSEIV